MSGGGRGDGPTSPTALEANLYWAALGRATAAWQFIESNLVQLYEFAIVGRHDNGAAASFHVPPGFRTRLEMVSAALEECDVPPVWLAAWRQLKRELSDLSSTRNIITHGTTIFDGSRAEGARLFLAKNLGNPAKRENVFDPSVGVDAEKLHASADKYDVAYDRLAAFSNYFANVRSGAFPREPNLPEGPLREMFPDLQK